MAFGLDYVSGPSVTAMKAAGVAFVCRYVGYFSGYNINAITTPQGKVLTPGEARTNSQGGIATVSNYEWYANRATDGTTAEIRSVNGAWDAHTANTIHLGCGGPADRPIYFSVDEDVDGAQVADYFRGVASTIGLSRTGAYGSYRVLKYLFDNHLISWGWQTYAWSGGVWEPRAHIQQYANSQTLGGHSVDFNRSMMPDFGQWIIGGVSMGVPAGWHDDGTTLTAPNGVPVVLGFREHILQYPGGWNPDNWPLSPEFHASPLEYSNPSLGDGQKLCCKWTTLEWTPARGVFEAYQGQEIYALLGLLAKASPTPIDPTALITAINAIADGVAKDVALALVEAKKL